MESTSWWSTGEPLGLKRSPVFAGKMGVGPREAPPPEHQLTPRLFSPVNPAALRRPTWSWRAP